MTNENTKQAIDDAVKSYSRLCKATDESWYGSGSTAVIAQLMLVDAVRELTEAVKAGGADE